MSIPLQPAGQALAETYRLAMDAIDVPLALLDVQGVIVDANPALSTWLRTERPALLGMRLQEWLHQPDTFAEPWARLWSQGGDVPGTARVATTARAADGTGLAAELRLTTLGSPASAVLACWQPQMSLEDAESAQRQLQLFADTVAHDLRAPLRSIDSFARLLETRVRDRLEPAEQDYLARIRTAAERMSGLLAALGELSRAMRTEFKADDVDLSPLADWAVAELQEAEPARLAQVSIQPGLIAHGDERLLGQLLRVLIDNAWKFSRSRDSTHITIDGRRIGDRLSVSVRDQGIGYDTRYAHKLFQPFQKLHSVEQGAGHGLGLAIADRIVRRHGGSLRASSDANGSVFTVELPAAKADQDPLHA